MPGQWVKELRIHTRVMRASEPLEPTSCLCRGEGNQEMLILIMSCRKSRCWVPTLKVSPSLLEPSGLPNLLTGFCTAMASLWVNPGTLESKYSPSKCCDLLLPPGGTM